MHFLLAVAYVSSATRRFAPKELDALLLDARAFNAIASVTGALLHQDGSFFQYFEGPEDGVEQVYSRIKRSRRHRGLIELVAAPVNQRHFSTWSMGFAEPVASELQAISQASWQAQRQAISMQDAPAPGLTLLLSFWQRAQASRGAA
ncbi:MAG: BLUF domain-containing protein [Rubrivivax sp.]|nr:BLUF domain-containing protein [Rubrivivax sp.]MDP3615467.1 BLUF domain-containing protein [Rubrivivax sp.]